MARSNGFAGLLAALALTAAGTGAARATAPLPSTRSTYGDLGILEMPSARMASDGQFSLNIAALDTTQRYSLTFQFLPWLDAAFRYSHINLGKWPDGSSDTYYDRSFGLKVRLSREGEYMPAISVGLRDILGTGLYGSEYLVASKQLGPVDASVGIGWGRLAGTNALPNPFGLVLSSFKTRSLATATLSRAGVFDFKSYFHGPKVGVFGGLIWYTPIPKLRFLLEYSSDRYNLPTFDRQFHVRVPVNFGFAYQLFDAVTLTGSWLYGTSYGLALNIAGDPTRSQVAGHIGPVAPLPVVRDQKQQMLALERMDQQAPGKARIANNWPWAQLAKAPPNPADSIAQVLFSTTRGVHDVEIDGTTLLIDVRDVGAPETRCDEYAHAISATDSHIDTIAITDPDDRSGAVTVCPVLQRASYQIPEAAPLAAPAAPPPEDAAETNPAREAKIRSDLDSQGLRLEAVASEDGEMWLYYENNKYFFETDAAGRVARVLMADAPPDIEIFHLVLVNSGVPVREFQIARSSLERATLASGSAAEADLGIIAKMPSLDTPALDLASRTSYPRYSWSVAPSMRESFFDPKHPLQFQFLVYADGRIDLYPGLSIGAGVDVNLYNDFNLNSPSASVLPHVRTDIAKYYKHGINGFSSLDITYRTRLGRDLLAEVKAGYLEDMFAGVGGQVLWRPDGSRLAFGVDAYEVWKRAFDRLAGLQSYHVLTGHASVYYESPWHGVNFALHVGRYLAGDYGGTFEVTRRFATGVEIGAFATITNVPSSVFGEGHFDKGIIIRIPLDWALPFYTQSSYAMDLSPLTRDGGQRLDGDNSLYDDTRMSSYGEVSRALDQIVEPE